MHINTWYMSMLYNGSVPIALSLFLHLNNKDLLNLSLFLVIPQH